VAFHPKGTRQARHGGNGDAKSNVALISPFVLRFEEAEVELNQSCIADRGRGGNTKKKFQKTYIFSAGNFFISPNFGMLIVWKMDGRT
jgi:hypothetical protein